MNMGIELGLLHKASELNANPKDHLNDVVRIVKTLESHIDGTLVLTYEKLKELVAILTCYTIPVPVPIPLSLGISISRAVEYKEAEGSCYSEVQRLSYIPKDLVKKIRLGRMNGPEKAMYYGCLGSDSNSVGAALSEVQAEEGKTYNLLCSRTELKSITGTPDDSLQVIPLGIFDYLRRGSPIPFKLHDSYVEIYGFLRNSIHPEGFLAMQLCDAFLKDALKRGASDRLYSVTSLIAEDCTTLDVIDGLLYPSTKLDGYPNLALKPQAVDKKLRHESAVSIQILESYGFGVFKTKLLNQGMAHGATIEWD